MVVRKVRGSRLRGLNRDWWDSKTYKSINGWGYTRHAIKSTDKEERDDGDKI